MAHEVFISHSAQNREVADAICTALEKGGIRCWVAPRDVRPGRSFPGEITRAIQQSRVMLLIFSSHSNNSEQVLREVQLATDSRLPLVRFRIEDVSMNDDLKYFLSTPHWLDALTPPLSDHIARLETAIRELLGQVVEVTGKNVVESTIPPKVSAVAPPAGPHTVMPAVPPITPPPIPKESMAKGRSGPIASYATKKEDKAAARKSSTPWVLLAIGAALLFAGALCVIFLISLGHMKGSQQTRPAPSRTTKATGASPSPAVPPAHVAKVKQRPASQKAATPAAESEDSNEEESGSAFDRAGALHRQDESGSEEKSGPSAFDRAGSDIGSDEESAEPSPEER